MAFDIYVISFLFLVGLFLGTAFIIIGMKTPLKRKNYINICDNCNNTYKWFELIPFVNYFLSRGKCRHCHNKLSIYYPVLQIITAILYSLIAMLCIVSLNIIIWVSDFKYYIILDSPLIVTSIIILVSKLIFFGFRTFTISLFSGLFIFLFMLIIKMIGDSFFGRESLGGGDIKLSIIFGFVFGIRLSIITLIVGSLLAFPYAIYSSLNNKNQLIPFGPFLVSALLVVYVFMEPIKSFLSIIFVGF